MASEIIGLPTINTNNMKSTIF